LKGGRTDRSDRNVVLNKDGAVGTGDLTLDVTGSNTPRLQITDNGGAVDNRIDDSASLYLEHLADQFTSVKLDADVDETIGGLYFDGVQQAAGTYGSTSSGASNQSDDWFKDTGILRVVPEPATMAILAFGGLGVLIRRRRR